MTDETTPRSCSCSLARFWKYGRAIKIVGGDEDSQVCQIAREMMNILGTLTQIVADRDEMTIVTRPNPDFGGCVESVVPLAIFWDTMLQQIIDNPYAESCHGASVYSQRKQYVLFVHAVSDGVLILLLRPAATRFAGEESQPNC